MLFRFPTENEIAYHFPTASRVEEHLERARTDPDNHFHFATSLESIYQWVVLAEEFDEDPHDELDDLFGDLSITHPALSAAGALANWETDREYREAVAALHLLQDAFDEADREGWHHVANQVATWIVKVSNELNRDLEPVIDTIVAYIDDHFADADDIPLNTFTDFVGTVYEHHYDADDQAVLRAFVVTLHHANRYSAEGQPMQERTLLTEALDLAKVCGIDQRGLERRYVETFQAQATNQSDPVAAGKALREGLADDTVTRTLSDAEKQEWKREMNEAFRTGAQRLRREGTPLHTDEMDDAIRGDVQRKIRIFRQLSARYSRRGGLYWFATHDQFFPPENIDHQSTIDQFGTVAPSDTGHVVEQQPSGDGPDVTQTYLTNLSLYAPLAAQTLYRLIDDGLVTRGLLYGIVLDCERITDDDRWYLIQFINAVFDERYDEAVHLGVPRLESVLFHILRAKGEDVDALLETGTGTRTLGSLLDVLEDYVDSRFHKYLTYMYNDRRGELAGGNIRNRTAHGHLRMGEDTNFLSYLVLTDIIRILIVTDLDTYRAKFGLISEYELLDQMFQ